jgi:phenylacetate-CoA ligase
VSDPLIRSDVEGVHWPGLPSLSGAHILALLQQFEHSQWWPLATLRERQRMQLESLLLHASASVPFYADRLERAGYRPDGALSEDVWSAIPPLDRSAVQAAGASLNASRVPPTHGSVGTWKTSGSTGRPVTVLQTALVRQLRRAFTIRNHFWHRHDFGAKLAVIRNLPDGTAEYPQGMSLPHWGHVTEHVIVTGPSVSLAVTASTDQQVEWLERQQPDYLHAFATVTVDLLRHIRERGGGPRQLRHLTTFAEALAPETRVLCRQVWGLKLVDIYSAREVGVIALQCPENEHYHVQSEGILVEVLDEHDRPCAPGEVGRVVVTPLHNFATPLIRYGIGDYAEVGAPCGCGRGLPVLRRVLGRVRNMLSLPDGRRIWPRLSETRYGEVAPIRQFQVVQKARDRLEVRLAAERALTAAEEARLGDLIRARLGHKGFEFAFSYHDRIARSAGGKYEDFRSEI